MSPDPNPSTVAPTLVDNHRKPGEGLHLNVYGDHSQVVISHAQRDSTTHTLVAVWWTKRRIAGLVVGAATVLGTFVALAAWVGWVPFSG